MKASVEWLKEYSDIDVDSIKLGDILTMTGSKVETIEQKGNDIKNVVVGKILEIKKHEDSDHLVITQIDLGNEKVQIVTGANNIKEGDIIAYGLSGGVSVLHRVVETDKNSRIWRTKGDANEVSDPGAVSYEQYLGKMIFSLPYVGYLISVFKRRSIWLGTIAVGILLLILQQKETWKSGKEKTV